MPRHSRQLIKILTKFSAAMATELPLLSKLWREKEDITILKHCEPDGSIEKIIAQLVHLAYCGSTKNSIFVKYLKDGLLKKVLSPSMVVDCLTKISLGKKLQCYASAVEIISTCSTLLRYNDEETSAVGICRCLSKINFWLLENTIEVYKTLYACMEDSTFSNPTECIELIESAHNLLNNYVSSNDYEDLSFIGKLLYGEEEEVPTVQLLIRDLLSLQLDKVAAHPLYTVYENNLKSFMKYMTRFLNATPMYMQVERARGENPNKTIHSFLQIQVLNYLYVPSNKLADIYDNFIKVENIAFEQFVLEIFRFTSHNLLARDNALEKSMFMSFLFIKLPSVLRHLVVKYKQQNSLTEKALLSSLQQVYQLHDVSIALNCDAVVLFLNELLLKNVIDTKQMEHILKSSPSKVNAQNVKENNLIDQHLSQNKKCKDILTGLNLLYNEKKEALDKEISSLINSTDLITTIVVFASNDNMDLLLTYLLRINGASERCPDGLPDTQHELRSELFNNTFILLTYIGTIFGDQVYIKVVNDFPTSFYLKWKNDCTNIVCKKMFSQPVLDAMMDTILKNHAVATNKACWDEYCCSVGMIVKEMTQAHLRRHINTESLQKICENFKNKRPSLCICALVWLCTQYKSMPTSERSRTVKIINLFKRPHTNPVRAAVFSPIFASYSAELENDLVNANQKGKTASPMSLLSGVEQFSKIVKEIVHSSLNIWISRDLITKLRAIKKQMNIKMFSQCLVKLILESGNEEDASVFEKLCLCIILLEPVHFIQTIFTHTLKSLFYTTDIMNKFADPQGRCLSKCLSKAFYISLVLCQIEKQEKVERRPGKMMKLSPVVSADYQVLLDSFNSLLEDCSAILSTNEKNAVSSFIVTFIEEVSIATAYLKPALKIKHNVGAKCLENLPSSLSRDALTLLCDLSTSDGRNVAANFIMNMKK